MKSCVLLQLKANGMLADNCQQQAQHEAAKLTQAEQAAMARVAELEKVSLASFKLTCC